MQNNNNILLATILSAVVLIGWTWFYEKPRMEEYERQKQIYEEQKAEIEKKRKESPVNIDPSTVGDDNAQINQAQESDFNGKILIDEKKSVEQTSKHRVKIENSRINGSINLRGAKFDNLYLNDYKDTIDQSSENVTLFAPVGSSERYFADFGWVGTDNNIDLPGTNSLWKTTRKELNPDNSITLSWKNRQNILFTMDISVDENYMFEVVKKVQNLSKKPITLASYGRVNRLMVQAPVSNYILHEGPIGVFDGILTEMQYEDLAEENNQRFESKKSWLGLTDKYWLAAIIPQDHNIGAVFNYEQDSNGNIYNIGFVGSEQTILPGESVELNHKLFAGAKEVTLLDNYGKKYDIELFDRSVDFGWYYFLTKPFFFILKFFNGLFGNYGLAILAITILVKLAMLPLATKSYSAMARIKKLHPKIEEIRSKNKDNKMQVNKEIMELYKTEKVNPASGCLPMLVQIPVFFSLYKVLFVTIDMRHQPFFGWIKDLSAPDPTSIFNLFGLLPFEINGGFFMIGIWPILMGLTMILQQKLGPKITDPAQAKVMKILPFILMFIFAAFPAGLLIYWTWNNILSIIQQYVVNKKIESKE